MQSLTTKNSWKLEVVNVGIFWVDSSKKITFPEENIIPAKQTVETIFNQMSQNQKSWGHDSDE